MNQLISQKNLIGKVTFFAGIVIITIMLMFSVIELASRYGNFVSVIVNYGIQLCFGFVLIGLSEVIRLMDSSEQKTEEEAFVGGKFAQ